MKTLHVHIYSCYWSNHTFPNPVLHEWRTMTEVEFEALTKKATKFRVYPDGEAWLRLDRPYWK